MHDEPPLSVWATAQRPSVHQRRGRYVPESNAHPARMLPDVARHAIRAYTKPGDLVLDPMCGIGTTPVEAIHLGRDAVGIEYEARWAAMAAQNVSLARSQGATGNARVLTGDSMHIDALLDQQLRGRVALVLTSPPYGPTVHGQAKLDRRASSRPITKWDHRYSSDRRNLAYQGTSGLLSGFRAILAGCLPYLRPGGVVALTTRPWRRKGALIDLPAAVQNIGEQVGLMLLERNVALLAGIADDRLIPRASLFQLMEVRKARRAGKPLRVIAHEDVLVFRKP